MLGPSEQRLFVSMPGSSAVAVVDTASWSVEAAIPTGPAPTDLALQPDGKFLWVATGGDEDTGPALEAIDVATLEPASRWPVSGTPGEMAFDSDGRRVLAASASRGEVFVVDSWGREALQTLSVGGRPLALATSALSRSTYVVDEESGDVVVLSRAAADSGSFEIGRRAETAPGSVSIGFAPGDRFAFVANPKSGEVYVLDSATQRIVQSGRVGDEPDGIAFSELSAYVRSRRSEIVWIVPLSGVGVEGAPLPLVDFTGGHSPLGAAPRYAQGITPAPGGTAVLVANATDRAIYFYREGMAAPMGHFQNYGRAPRAVMVLDRSLREFEPGVYSTVVRLTRSGSFEIPFFLDSPRIVHCFSADVESDPEKRPETPGVPVSIRVLDELAGVRVGVSRRVRLEVRDVATDSPRSGLEDLGVLAYSSGNWQARQWAREVGEAGVYEIVLSPPTSGVFFLSFYCPSLGIGRNALRPVVFRAEEREQS